MTRLHERVRGGGPVLWVDYVDYAERLFEPGGVPWRDVARTLAWYRKAQGLLSSDVLAIPMWRLAEALLAGAPKLIDQMRAKARVTHPLRTLLSSEELRASAAELVRALRSVFPGELMALKLPSPRVAVLLAHRASSGAVTAVEIGEDEVDTAAPYVADFLRCFSDTGLDVLLLEESMAPTPAEAVDFEWYRPVYNVAQHYDWAVGLEMQDVSQALLKAAIEFAIPRPADGSTEDLAPVRVAIAAGKPGEPAHFDFLRLPRGAEPERVLQELQAMRRGAGH